MVITFIPYSLEKNIGKAYNQCMSMLKEDDDWGCLTDGDIMFMTPDWGHQLQELVDLHPNAGIITCMTNRIANKYQRTGNGSTNILDHYKIAQQRLRVRRGKTHLTRRHISGFLMMVKKSTWNEVKFPEIENAILDIDGLFSNAILDAKKDIVIAEGLYVLHYYRWAQGTASKSHLGRNRTNSKKQLAKSKRMKRNMERKAIRRRNR